MKLSKFLILLLLANFSFAQHITTAEIKTVSKDGLYKIVLPPEIRSFSKENLSDFRIFDKKGIEVPYFIDPRNKNLSSNHFQEYRILSKTVIPKKNTSVIIENPKKTINEITLSISNSDVTKTYSISGSNDQKEWFGLLNNEQLHDLNNTESISIYKTILFPLCSYRYLKIDFDDKKTLPVNVLKAGTLSTKTQNVFLDEITSKSINTTQIASEKKTRIQITFRNPQIINQLVFTVSSPSYYKRNARIYLNKTHKIKRRTETYQEEIAAFELNAENENTFDIPQLFEKEFIIEIENQDNQPLVFSEIKCNQIPVSIIADLKANQKYSVKTGNPKLNAPQYDLSFFDTNSNELPGTSILQIKHQNQEKKVVLTKPFWQQSWFMWLCIAVGGIAILYFTINLVKDMKNN